MIRSGSIHVLAMLEAQNVSGSAKAVLEFAREASRNRSDSSGIDVSIVTFSRSREENKLTQEIRDAGIELEVIFEHGRFDQGVIPQLRALMKARRPHLIWSNAVKSHFLVRLAGLHHSAKWVAFHHGYTAEDIKVRLYNQLDRWSLRKADCVITVCRPFADDLQGRGVSADRIRIQHMPIRPLEPASREQVAALRKQLAIADNARVLLSVGRLSFEKGHADLVRAFDLLRQRNPDLPMRLVLAGDGPERSNLRLLCEHLGLGADISLVGYQHDVRPYYAMADLFVLPSHSEGSPNVLLEAMSMEVPVVTTSVGGIPELVTHGSDALLVEKCDVRSLADALAQVLQNSRLAESLRRAGRESVLQYSTEAYYLTIAGIFREICSTRTGGGELHVSSAEAHDDSQAYR
jgi:glycosyltransferase involved in cell wall biosynthesis